MIPSTDRFGAALGNIVRCPRCTHAQVDPMPDATVIDEAYAHAESHDYIVEQQGQRETARRTLHRLEKYVPDRGPLLDLGCWVGYLLAEAQARGWPATGVEPSEFASRFAREQLDLDVITGELFSAPLRSAAFAAVTMSDLIEHLTDPGAALDRVRDLLTPGGILWLALPDAGSLAARLLRRRWWSVIPTHVQYFTRTSIAVLLARHGFEVVESATAPKVFTVRYYLNRISGYSPAAGRALVRSATAVGVADRLWAPDFHDRMAVIARVA